MKSRPGRKESRMGSPWAPILAVPTFIPAIPRPLLETTEAYHLELGRQDFPDLARRRGSFIEDLVEDAIPALVGAGSDAGEEFVKGGAHGMEIAQRSNLALEPLAGGLSPRHAWRGRRLAPRRLLRESLPRLGAPVEQDRHFAAVCHGKIERAVSVQVAKSD